MFGFSLTCVSLCDLFYRAVILCDWSRTRSIRYLPSCIIERRCAFKRRCITAEYNSSQSKTKGAQLTSHCFLTQKLELAFVKKNTLAMKNNTWNTKVIMTATFEYLVSRDSFTFVVQEP